MENKPILHAAKVIGSALIVIAAAFILLPSLLGYLFGLGRILLIVGTTLILATAAGNIVFRLAKRNRAPKQLTEEGTLTASGGCQGVAMPQAAAQNAAEPPRTKEASETPSQ
jgi:uncharacterized protein (DUF58 family)